MYHFTGLTHYSLSWRENIPHCRRLSVVSDWFILGFRCRCANDALQGYRYEDHTITEADLGEGPGSPLILGKKGRYDRMEKSRQGK